jgi:hypothetical protein
MNGGTIKLWTAGVLNLSGLSDYRTVGLSIRSLFSTDNFSVFMYNFIHFDSMKFILNHIDSPPIPTTNCLRNYLISKWKQCNCHIRIYTCKQKSVNVSHKTKYKIKILTLYEIVAFQIKLLHNKFSRGVFISPSFSLKIYSLHMFDDFSFYFQYEDYQWHFICLMTFLSIFRMKTTSDMLYVWWLFFLFSGWRLPVTCYMFDDFSFYFQDEDYQWHVICLMTFLSIFRMKTTSDMLYVWW